MSVLVSSNADISWARLYPHLKCFQVASSGAYIAIYKDTGSGNLYYRTSSDLGITWSAATVLPGSPTNVNIRSIDLIGDVLYLWYSGTSIQVYQTTYNTGTNIFGVQTVHSYTFSGITSFTTLDALYANGIWNITAWAVKPGSNTVVLFQTPGFDGTLATSMNFVDLNYRHTGITGLRATPVSGYIHVSFYDSTTKQLKLAPIVVTGSTLNYNTGSLETPASLSDTSATFDIAEELDSTQTIIAANGGLLYSLKRTGVNTYGTLVPLQSQVVVTHTPALVLDTADLYVGFQSTVNQPNGEVYLLKRQGSQWQLPIVLAGGSSSGYQTPVLALSSSLYQDNAHNVYYQNWQKAAAPLAPTNVHPVGNETSLTPAATWTSNRGAPQDPPKQQQIQTLRVSDNAVMDDSGAITWTGSYVIPSGAALAFGIAYKVQVREKDSLTALGAGTFGPYSTFVVFTPQHGATVTIASVTSGGGTSSSFPATIGGNDIQAHVNYTQTDGHSTNLYRMNLYLADAATLVAQSAWTTLTPAVASGSPFDTLDWSPGVIINGDSYYVSVSTTDTVTAVVSESSRVRLNVAYSVPPGPSGLVAVPKPDLGWVQLNWVNDVSTVSVTVEWQPYTETGVAMGWVTLSNGTLINQLITPNQSPQLKSDYRVTLHDSLGIPSVSGTVLGVYLDNALDYAGIHVNDVTDFMNSRFYAGYVDNWDALKRDLAWDVQEFVPMGASKPVHIFGLKDYWILGTSQALKLFLPASELDSSGNISYGADNRDRAIKMCRSRNVLLYRDRRFPVPLFVRFANYEDQPNDDVNTDMTFELHETGYVGGYPVAGSLI